MDLLKIIVQPLLVIAVLSFSSASSGQDTGAGPCIECHKDTYEKALSYKYQHTVFQDKCQVCHMNTEKKDNIAAQMNSPYLLREWLINLDRLSGNQGYQADVAVTDSSGRKGPPSRVDIIPRNAWEPDGQHAVFKLTEITGINVKEIRRRGFVRATITWESNAFSTTEAEYRVRGQRPDSYKTDGLYTKSHIITLNGLKYKSKYFFRAVSRDIYGNTLKSEEISFDTSEEFTRPQVEESKDDDSSLPAIEHMQVIRGQDGTGLYLKVTANKSCGISVIVKEVMKKDDKHGFGLLPARYSRIDICYKCHPHDSSHPVGIKAESPKTRTPVDLPTIEGGIITCVTCHTPHGGDRLHFNRFDFRKELCMRCHLEKYDNL
ncbi:MAG: cytochrome c3 family protein [Nitrospirota bacterium]